MDNPQLIVSEAIRSQLNHGFFCTGKKTLNFKVFFITGQPIDLTADQTSSNDETAWRIGSSGGGRRCGFTVVSRALCTASPCRG
ncbi:hypothetical protein [Pseudomonas cannabina]|uniref:hypothetical protein n=1 Tax=Pseudomonas cannabina TaxID=86840 RepID=UPI0012E21C43|nr:hypothetical protein [Pseudomonas cannabina]